MSAAIAEPNDCSKVSDDHHSADHNATMTPVEIEDGFVPFAGKDEGFKFLEVVLESVEDDLAQYSKFLQCM